ncbi:MAG: hypothetical protein V2I56_06750 [Desulfobacteraceae bacterium]|jgi:hypothetical protein|nr:hypothetical protein [Desulfobacteraceae bacterium]
MSSSRRRFLLGLKIWVEIKGAVKKPSEKMHAHRRKLLSANAKPPFYRITFGCSTKNHSMVYFIGAEVGVTLNCCRVVETMHELCNVKEPQLLAALKTL